MTTLKKLRKAFNEHPAYYGFCAGSTVTSLALLWITRDSTILRLTDENAELLKTGGAVFWNLKDQTVHLVNIPAVEAAQAAL